MDNVKRKLARIIKELTEIAEDDITSARIEYHKSGAKLATARDRVRTALLQLRDAEGRL